MSIINELILSLALSFVFFFIFFNAVSFIVNLRFEKSKSKKLRNFYERK